MRRNTSRRAEAIEYMKGQGLTEGQAQRSYDLGVFFGRTSKIAWSKMAVHLAAEQLSKRLGRDVKASLHYTAADALLLLAELRALKDNLKRRGVVI